MNTAHKLQLIRRKRYALEQLIDIGKNIIAQGNALNDILVLSLPSQKIPEKTRKRVLHMVHTLQDLSIDELTQRLKIIDQLVEQGSKEIVNFSFDRDAASHNTDDIIIIVEHIKQLISVFKKRTELAIALRLTLQEMGVTTQRLHAGFSQELLSKRVGELKQEEIQCRDNIYSHIKDVIEDCNLLLTVGSMSPTLEAELKHVRSVMKQNLKHLETGKSINSMPVNFEVIEIGDSSPHIQTTKTKTPLNNKTEDIIIPDITAPKTQEHTIGEKSALKQTIHPSFLKRVLNWLNSPWNVGWKASNKKK